MTLKGLPESPLPPGSVVLTSLLSALVSTAGLSLLRSTRPTKVVELSRTTSIYGGLPPWFYYKVLGIFGALLMYLGQVFGSFPMLMGVSTDDEGKAAAIVQCTQVLLCWAVERYHIVGHALPMMQSCACAVVWFGSTLVEWAGPRPYDNIRLGLQSQVSGCDGGYRSPFLVYAAGSLTGITFGVLFLCVDERWLRQKRLSGELEDGRDHLEATPGTLPRVAACKALPAIYGLSLAMSGMVFGLGTSANDMRWVVFGALLLVVAVACAWEWLWCLEHSLGTWAAVSQCFATICRLGQAHLVFRDFRWDPNSVTGMLVMWKWPGLQLFLCGFVLLMTMVQVWNNTCTSSDWGRGASSKAGMSPRSRGHQAQEPPAKRMSIATVLLYILQWILLPVCMTCCVIGVSTPLVETKIFVPEVRWLADEAAIMRYENTTRPGTGHVIKHGKSYLGLISALYAGRVPCSALVVAYNSVVMPPLQFTGFLLVLLGKGRLIKIRQETMDAIKQYTLHQAPMRFTNPMVLMTGVAVIQLTAPSGKMEAGFTPGYWYFIAYVCSCLVLAWSLNLDLDSEPQKPQAHEKRLKLELPGVGDQDMKVHLSKASRLQNEDSYNEDDESDLELDPKTDQWRAPDFRSQFWELVTVVCLLPTIVVSMYLALTEPFLTFDYRLSGILVQKREPSVLEIWRSLGSKSRFLKYFSAVTLIATLAVWVVLAGLKLLAKSRHRPGSRPRLISQLVNALEQIVRPWVLGNVWAFCLVLVYYIVSARNKAPIEVCAHFPHRPVGFLSVLVMGGSMIGLQHVIRGLLDPPDQRHRDSGLHLPGGNWLWYTGAGVVAVFWLFVLFTHGPTLDPTITSLDDVNTVLSKLLPVTNTHLRKQMPESSGDCNALWEHRIVNGKALYASPPSEVHRRCRGSAPLVHHTMRRGRNTMSVMAKWATGLNTLDIMDILIMPPANISAYTQEWNMTVRAKFTDLHVWLKVLLNNEKWVDDYMCCDNPFLITLEASVRCTLGEGFHPIQLHAKHVDHVIFKHHVEVQKTPDSQLTWDIKYGRNVNVEKALRNVLTGKQGKLLIKNSDGSTTDPLASASDVLNSIVFLNTGQQCLYKW